MRPLAGSSSRDPGKRRPKGRRRRAKGAGSRLEGEGSVREVPARAASSRRHGVAAGCGKRSDRVVRRRSRGFGVVLLRIWDSILLCVFPFEDPWFVPAHLLIRVGPRCKLLSTT